jgi:hypothetical protein
VFGGSLPVRYTPLKLPKSASLLIEKRPSALAHVHAVASPASARSPASGPVPASAPASAAVDPSSPQAIVTKTQKRSARTANS